MVLFDLSNGSFSCCLVFYSVSFAFCFNFISYSCIRLLLIVLSLLIVSVWIFFVFTFTQIQISCFIFFTPHQFTVYWVYSLLIIMFYFLFSDYRVQFWYLWFHSISSVFSSVPPVSPLVRISFSSVLLLALATPTHTWSHPSQLLLISLSASAHLTSQCLVQKSVEHYVGFHTKSESWSVFFFLSPCASLSLLIALSFAARRLFSLNKVQLYFMETLHVGLDSWVQFFYRL